jgi:hypothetical protein
VRFLVPVTVTRYCGQPFPLPRGSGQLSCGGARSYSVPSFQSPRRFPRSVIGRAGAIALKHRVRAPPHQPLEIALLTAGEQKVVSVVVPESMWVDLGGVEPGHVRTDLQPFAYTIRCEAAALTEEQRRARCVPVMRRSRR